MICYNCGEKLTGKWYFFDGKGARGYHTGRYCKGCMLDRYPDLLDTFERNTQKKRCRMP